MRSLCDQPFYDNHEMVLRLRNPYTGLEGVISIHDTSFGPAFGGTRLWKYASEDDMYADAHRLSRAMTYKHAIHGLLYGGGKAVFNRNPKRGVTKAELIWYADVLKDLGGLFSTAEDIGFKIRYINYLSHCTKYVAGKSRKRGGGGDPSRRTAEGLIHAMHACLASKNEYSGTFYALASCKIFVQGAGKVGEPLIEKLLQRGAHVFFCDTEEKRALRIKKRFHGSAFMQQPDTFDFFAPCGIGGTVNAETIPRLKCRFIVGSANNVLRDPPHDARMLKKHNIILAPDYVANGGGMINIASEMRPGGYDDAWAQEKTASIFDLTLRILQTADAYGLTTMEVADHIALEQLKHARQKRKEEFQEWSPR